jgi:hypothetical protein
MSVANIGGVVLAVQQILSVSAANTGGFGSSKARQNQGVAVMADAIREILSRADLASSLNAKLYYPTYNGTSVKSVTSSTTGQLVAAVVDNSNAAGTDAYVQLFNTASGSVTIGTTGEYLDLHVLGNAMGCFLFPDVPAFGTAIAWDATTAAHGNTRSTSATVGLMLVYVA